MDPNISAAFIIASIFLFFPFIVWFIRNYYRYGRRSDTSGLTTFLRFSFHLLIPSIILYAIGFMGLFNIL